MNESDRFRRLEALFHAALDIQPDERDTFLRSECGDDQDLLNSLHKLLMREPSGTALGALSSLDPSNSERIDIAGHRIGAYEIRHELGSGGMGTVYLASRADEAYEKDVAIKVVQDRLSRELVERFRNERQILATLEHPNIARLLDGGATDDGFPYVVMEYIDGLPIDEFCDRRRLSIRQRLELFVDVCAGVQFAHRNLVVHRDIKPQNILVTGDGTPRLLDFGIAKLLARDLRSPAGLTVAAARRMTPAYASPEQVRGEPVTTASDVYSLGMLLFELLTGRPPYRIEAMTAIDVERTICETTPPAPSSCVTAERNDGSDSSGEALAQARSSTPERLRSLLRGDLDNIILMALRKEPDRRYRTAEALADDIQAYLANRPVAARQDTWSYRAGKFVKRNRVAAAATAVVFLSVVAAAAVSLNYAISESRQRALAEQRFEDVRELATTLLYDVHDAVANEGPTATRNLLVATGTEYLNALGSEDPDDPALKRDIARGYIRLARIQGDPATANRGDTETATQNVLYGMSLVDELLVESPEHVDTMLVAAEAHEALAGLSRHEHDLPISIEHYEESVRLRRAVADRHPDLALARPRLDSIYWSYALALIKGGRHGEAAHLYEQVVGLIGELVQTHPDRPDLAELLLVARAYQGDALQQAGEFDEARQRLEPLIAEIERVLTERPASNRLTQALAAAQVNLGRVYDAQGEHARAEPLLVSALELHERLSATDPQNMMMWRGVALAHHWLGRLYDNTGRFEKALEKYQRMLQIDRKIAERDPASMTFRRAHAVALDMTGFALRKLGRNTEALQHHREANQIFIELADSRPDDFAAQRGLSVSWYFLGQLERDMAMQEPQVSAGRTKRLHSAVRAFDSAREIMIRVRDAGKLPAGDADVIDMLSGEIDTTQAAISQSP